MIYIVKYGAIALFACSLGFVLSLVIKELFLENIYLYMGPSDYTLLSFLSGIGGSVLIFLVLIMYVNGILKSFHKISAAEAMCFATPQEKVKWIKGFQLSRNKVFSLNSFLLVDGKEASLSIAAIYSDITNGGKTANGLLPTTTQDVPWVTMPVKLTNDALIDLEIAKYREIFLYAKVSNVEEYLKQTLGFTDSTIYRQYLVRATIILILSIIMGTVLSNSLGELVGGALMK